MKNFKFIFLSLLTCAFMFSACSKSDDNPSPGNTVKKVQYKIIGSADTKISIVVYHEGESYVTDSSDKGSTWTSKENISSKTPIVTANATGLSDASTLKAQILVDGKVVKESAASVGKILSTSISYF